jgi:hypothetical protein
MHIFLTVLIVEITLMKIFLCTLSACGVKKRLKKLVAILIFAAVVNMCNTN